MRSGYSTGLMISAQTGITTEDFCQEHETISGYIHDDKLRADFPVYADIHPAENHPKQR